MTSFRARRSIRYLCFPAPCRLLLCALVFVQFGHSNASGQTPLAESDSAGDGSKVTQLKVKAREVAQACVATLTKRYATHGGYLWQYSLDGRQREGEGVVTTKTIWVQPPATPTVGMALVRLYEATGERQFLVAARSAAEALRQGQMKSGGWQAQVEFEPGRRKKWAYRTDGTRRVKDQSSLDDDKTQSAIRFLIALDLATSQQDAVVHEMVEYALSGLVANQLPCGAFPQVYPVPSEFPGRNNTPSSATFPETWPKAYPGHGEYWYKPTLNDNLAGDVTRTLTMAHAAYGDSKYMEAAVQLGDFLIRAQLPEPQPAWAQQYSYDLHPIWARRFEPAAVTGGESQDVMSALMDLYELTGDKRFLEPIPRAVEYLKQSRLPNGKLARFYEMNSNRPLYFDRKYNLTFDSSDSPTHYSFEVADRLDAIDRRYKAIQASGVAPKVARSDTKEKRHDRIRQLIESAGEGSVWASPGRLRFHKTQCVVVDMKIVADNLTQLAEFINN